MPSFHKLHASYPRAAYRTCEFCHTPLSQPRRGRTRVTCSDSCRQKLFRWRRRHLTADQRRWDEEDRRADRAIARWQKQFGPFDPDTQWGLRYRLTRGIPIPTCVQCGRPIVPSNITGPPPDYCSPACQQQAKKRYSAIHTAVYEKRLWSRISPQAVERIRQNQPLLICAHCGIPFVRRSTTGRIPRFCSEPCRQAAYWTRSHGRILRRADCPTCGSRFAAAHPNQKYCSNHCARRAADHRPRRTTFWGVCIICGVKIENRRRGGPARLYCSSHCRHAAEWRRKKQRRELARPQPRRCLWCGALLDPESRADRRYCDRSCANHYHNQRYRLLRSSSRP